MNRGTGYLPICNNCVNKIYSQYLSDGAKTNDAARRLCRNLNLYWSPAVFATTEKTNAPRSVILEYIKKINSVALAGKTYDDTLEELGVEWAWPERAVSGATTVTNDDGETIEISEDVIQFWGPGYPASTYLELEDRFAFWMSDFPQGTELDIGSKALLRQICNLEIDINHARAAGNPIDKSVTTLNNLLGSLNLKPAQKKSDGDSDLDNMPFGVGIEKWEYSRPIPEADPEFKDVNGIVHYITVWFLGHLCKMLGIKNSYCKLYEDEIERLRVEHPEYEDEDDEGLFNNIFGNEDDDEQQ
jgi:hypothetical protein